MNDTRNEHESLDSSISGEHMKETLSVQDRMSPNHTTDKAGETRTLVSSIIFITQEEIGLGHGNRKTDKE